MNTRDRLLAIASGEAASGRPAPRSATLTGKSKCSFAAETPTSLSGNVSDQEPTDSPSSRTADDYYEAYVAANAERVVDLFYTLSEQLAPAIDVVIARSSIGDHVEAANQWRFPMSGMRSRD